MYVCMCMCTCTHHKAQLINRSLPNKIHSFEARVRTHVYKNTCGSCQPKEKKSPKVHVINNTRPMARQMMIIIGTVTCISIIQVISPLISHYHISGADYLIYWVMHLHHTRFTCICLRVRTYLQIFSHNQSLDFVS